MDTRRDFLKKAIMLSGSAGMAGVLPESVQRAFAIDPVKGSTYLDAEHVVILMQENRSFDHCFGTMQGVRGFNDPRAITLPDKNLVWLQTNEAAETYAPFRFDIRNTKATWLGSTPHSRSSQIDANNLGKYDRWLQAKRVADPKYAGAPMTMGHYSREDIPFYYALADAFTVCDQNFCSAMTSTNPNRLFFWTGTATEQHKGEKRSFIRNLGDWRIANLKYKTFPERLEDNGISWKFYQNDIDTGGGFTGDERAWLANFGCNPLEWFESYHVKFTPRYIQGLRKQVAKLPAEIKTLETKFQSLSATDQAFTKTKAAITAKKEVLDKASKELAEWTKEKYDSLSAKQKSLYQRAFTTNEGDPHYHELTTLNYEENGEKRQLPIPNGDVLHQFRKDVETGKLPTVSWLSAAQNLSDHPSAPWYGALYASEIMNILTKNPEVWKKTIFIVTFDENDGYYDHIPPFVAPDPLDPSTGKCSPGIDTEIEYRRLEDEVKEGQPSGEARGGPIGLGFRVPMVIASPWTRGGSVCSQVFDHTSTLQFLEGFLKKKYNKDVKETNISDWRRTITGDLTAAFKSYNGDQLRNLPFLQKDRFIEKIYNAKFKKDITGFQPLTKEEIAEINRNPLSASAMKPHQEKGLRPSSALPYQLYVDGKLSDDKKTFDLNFSASTEIFGAQSAGSPFNVYFPGKYAGKNGEFEHVGSRSYAVVAGGILKDSFPLESFEKGEYHLKVYGPNGFFREFKGKVADPQAAIVCEYERASGSAKKLTGNMEIQIKNPDTANPFSIEIKDNAYKNKTIQKVIPANTNSTVLLNLSKSFGWYDFTVRIIGADHFEKRYAGRVETGEDSFTDPLMGNAVV
ncbi:MAG: phospholipase C, phosphocholine-specific [Chitinophagaceae bacterium]